uniref:Uncharacterized protein n=1 Tax=Arundo donax TaxID=35708 RepID=A0A0A9H131_ARUDO
MSGRIGARRTSGSGAPAESVAMSPSRALTETRGRAAAAIYGGGG